MRVDKFNIRLKNISPQLARGLVDGLGQGLLNELTNSTQLLISSNHKKRNMKIDKMDLGSLKYQSSNQNSLDLQKLIVNRIGHSLSQFIDEKDKGGDDMDIGN